MAFHFCRISGIQNNSTILFKAFSGWETRFGPVLNLAAVVVTPNVMVSTTYGQVIFEPYRRLHVPDCYCRNKLPYSLDVH